MVGLNKLLSLLCAVPFLIACSESEGIAQETGETVSPLAIEEYLNQKLRALHPDFPDAQIVQLRVSPDGIVACGWAVSSGEDPILFVSTDKTPLNPDDRSIALSRITTAAGWGAEPFQASDQLAREVCSRSGLMTPQPS